MSKFEARNPKLETISNDRNIKHRVQIDPSDSALRARMQTITFEAGKKFQTKQYDLEDRTFIFAKDVRVFAKQIPKTLANIEDIKQVVRASGSIGANYIEANESLSKKDFVMRIKICRKEAKESRYWLRLIDAGNDSTVEKPSG
jgi:four helix bundle protein